LHRIKKILLNKFPDWNHEKLWTDAFHAKPTQVGEGFAADLVYIDREDTISKVL